MSDFAVTTASGAAVAPEGKDIFGHVSRALTVDETDGKRLKSWFQRLVVSYLKHHYARRPRASTDVIAGDNETARARAVIRAACIKSSLTGAAAGLLSTGATLITAETQGWAGLLAIPAAAAGIAGEMIYRAIIHLEMTCDIGDVFGVRFDPDDPQDLMRLFGLAFGSSKKADDQDPSQEVVSRITETESKEVAEAIGGKLLGESLLRNVVPVLGIVTSSVGNWRMTQRVGDTVRRYVRYRRALHDALRGCDATIAAHMDLLIEGIWFLFSADGHLSDEETALLSTYLRRLEAPERASITARFIEEEHDWLTRLPAIPEAHRDIYLYALAVAAAVDKIVSLPERKILAQAAHALGRTFDPVAVEAMIDQLETTGVLTLAHKPPLPPR